MFKYAPLGELVPFNKKQAIAGRNGKKIMDITTYAVIPCWVLQSCADWQEFDSPMKRIEAKNFFENRQEKKTYILEEPESVIELSNHCYLHELQEMAAEFGAKVIRWDSDKARKFYLARVKMRAKQFEMTVNPFSEAFLA